MKLSKNRKIVLWVTVIAIVIFLGLDAKEERIPGKHIEARFEFYGFTIGYYKLDAPIIDNNGEILYRGGIIDKGLHRIDFLARYKYQLAIGAFLVGLASLLCVKDT